MPEAERERRTYDLWDLCFLPGPFIALGERADPESVELWFAKLGELMDHAARDDDYLDQVLSNERRTLAVTTTGDGHARVERLLAALRACPPYVLCVYDVGPLGEDPIEGLWRVAQGGEPDDVRRWVGREGPLLHVIASEAGQRRVLARLRAAR